MNPDFRNESTKLKNTQDFLTNGSVKNSSSKKIKLFMKLILKISQYMQFFSVII